MTDHCPFARQSRRLTILHEPVEMLSDVCGLRRRMGESDGPVERGARLVAAAQLQKQLALHAEEME
jgi:hypothetical protein